MKADSPPSEGEDCAVFAVPAPGPLSPRLAARFGWFCSVPPQVETRFWYRCPRTPASSAPGDRPSIVSPSPSSRQLLLFGLGDGNLWSVVSFFLFKPKILNSTRCSMETPSVLPFFWSKAGLSNAFSPGATSTSWLPSEGRM